MNILVTGGAGFIGSTFIKYALKNRNDMLINLDSLTYAGSMRNLEEVADHPRHRFIHGDIRDGVLLDDIFQRYGIQAVINFAAESHVDRSIIDPAIFIGTNVIGTHSLLEAAKRHWKLDPLSKQCQDYKSGVKYIQISTDEVYGSLGQYGYFTETTNLSPNSPYSASKAAADLLVNAYHQTFGFPAVITRCSNNYGPYQFPEKLIPLMIHKALREEKLPLYGDGKNRRDWIHVEDHCRAIDIVLEKGKIGEVYNIGGNHERENHEIIQQILALLGKKESLIEFVEDRLGHDRRYAMDITKIRSELGWTPSIPFDEGLRSTVEWYVNHSEWVEAMSRETVT
ncbi:dTDP-glucose 4,6-dehydratase [Sporosarcina sp. 179-K 3D1 HS]|uniref:dTDP-glucose 4,6-dehydratase n=1 Tax=Sporosarcina sp. 179-K 3D1 HS TaxID=3232169 RepID=UPI00399F64E2